MTGNAGTSLPLWAALTAFVAAAAAAYGAILWLRPLLTRVALARPNARSSHGEPTPQGGGIAVVGATLAVMVIGFAALGPHGGATAAHMAAVVAATLLLALSGAADDIRGLAPTPRLALHIVAVAVVVYALPHDARLVPMLPWWLERALLLLAGIWFVNLVNFMDGIDWMTVAEVVPVATGLAIAGALGALPPLGTLTAIALAGAMIGFAPFNRPVASLFLGDVGSVPIGLVLAWLLFLLASGGHLAAAVLLPLYYLADASITLARRLARGDRIWEAHRTHFYQRATDHGMSVRAIVGHVFAVNIALVVLAAATIQWRSIVADMAALSLGAALVGWLLWRFAGRNN
jgi:UDP-N-acetylmuramyl pentapeptide phosphotransferase/UDP-N-acetylglucosamine-1-phosphate transferase